MRQLIYSDDIWPREVANLITNQIKSTLSAKQYCSVLLTGGKGASRVYAVLSTELTKCEGEIDFFLGDERCVPQNDPDSNYGMILKTLFPLGMQRGQVLYQMFDAKDNAESAALKYETILPLKIDIVLLGLGDDGHIASLFPGTAWNVTKGRKVTTGVSPVNGIQRVSITKDVIESASEIIVFASGENKKKVLAAIDAGTEIDDIPAIIASRGIWVLDESATGKLKSLGNKDSISINN
jgi:6-phosphogluconolactonase